MTWVSYRWESIPDHAVAAWRALRADLPHFQSPFFTPEYVACVAESLPGIEVAFLERNSQVVAVFPFERKLGGNAGPVGRDLCDYQGPIYHPDTQWDPLEMLQSLDLQRWSFDHLFPFDGPLAAWCWTDWDSPQIVFAGGHPAFYHDFATLHKKLIHSTRRKERKLHAERGPVTHRTELVCPKQLEQLLTWKSNQYEATGREHPFRESWVLHFLQRSMEQHHKAYRGRLSGLFVGECPIALEYSLQSESTSHMLLCAYDPAYARYSPGLMRNLKLIESGLPGDRSILDFGKGLEAYKRDIMNANPRLGEGAVDAHRVRSALKRSWQKSRYWFLRSQVSGPAKHMARLTASQLPLLRRWLAMR